MPIEVGVWKLGSGAATERIHFSPLKAEGKLEDILDNDITILDPRLLVIGRQVVTAFGKFIDLLAMDADGKLVVIELKRDRTPREVVAQLLDYGSWVRTLEDDDIAAIFDAYLNKYHPDHVGTGLDQAFCERFGVTEMPETLNEGHELVVGGGSWYSNTLNQLEPNDRIWVNVPGRGYVGVGRVTEKATPITNFMLADGTGQKRPIKKVVTATPSATVPQEELEYYVKVDWIKTVPLNEAIKEKGFFGNQNSVAKPKAKKWIHTIDRLKKRFEIPE